jgi:maltooligosyltrehalose trehalohydrolase
MKSSALEVWAPFAGKMEAVVDGECFKMHRDPTREGWWTTDAEFPTGTRYGFSPEGRGPFPDPRSQHQPDGIHAQSCLLDHGAFPWTDHGWQPPAWEQSVVYEIHIGTFSEEGTFDGAIPHLDHLARLGITHVEIMPCAGFPGSRNWGYDCVSINAPNEVYGGPDGLKRLVDACHARGLAVIMDVIYNHMGAEGDHTADLAPYFTDRYHTPWGGGPDLDGELSPEVRAFFLDNALMWLRDYHADGLRLDAIDKVTDGSPRHFLVELRAAVDQLAGETGQRKVLIAESAANDPIFVQPVTTGGYGMDAQWADDVHHSLHGFFSGERQNYYADFGELDDLAKALRQGFVYDGFHVSGLSHQSRSGGQPAQGRALPSSSRSGQGRPENRFRPLAALPFRPDDLHGGGVGRQHTLRVLHRSSGSRNGGGCRQRAQRGIRR